MPPEPEFERYYTVEEANAELDRLRTSIDRIREAREVVFRTATRIEEGAAADGGGRDAAPYWDAVRTLRQELEGFSAAGIILRDADSGLVDFPARREGRAVFLCWRAEEYEVSYWHEVNAGFTGRKPL